MTATPDYFSNAGKSPQNQGDRFRQQVQSGRNIGAPGSIIAPNVGTGDRNIQRLSHPMVPGGSKPPNPNAHLAPAQTMIAMTQRRTRLSQQGFGPTRP
jgi:hypothetical protein